MDRFSKDLKRKAPAIAVGLAKRAVKRKASATYKKAAKRVRAVKDIFS